MTANVYMDLKQGLNEATFTELVQSQLKRQTGLDIPITLRHRPGLQERMVVVLDCATV
jgi:hypothetical protein